MTDFASSAEAKKNTKDELRYGMSIRNFWATPLDVFDALDKEFDFDCDAAAEASTAKCAEWYGPDHPLPERRDSLRGSGRWVGKRSFVNCPYSPDGGGIEQWVMRAEMEAQEKEHVVMLLPGTADTLWAQILWTIGAELRFTPRIRFKDPLTDRARPMGGSLIAVLRPNQVPRVPGRRSPGEELIQIGYAPWRNL